MTGTIILSFLPKRGESENVIVLTPLHADHRPSMIKKPKRGNREKHGYSLRKMLAGRKKNFLGRLGKIPSPQEGADEIRPVILSLVRAKPGFRGIAG
jgi:hypothetical protein